jgi:hypothetical protein
LDERHCYSIEEPQGGGVIVAKMKLPLITSKSAGLTTAGGWIMVSTKVNKIIIIDRDLIED